MYDCPQELVLLALHLQHTALGACYYYGLVVVCRFCLLGNSCQPLFLASDSPSHMAVHALRPQARPPICIYLQCLDEDLDALARAVDLLTFGLKSQSSRHLAL
jgi:hypothetical protein